MRRIAFCLLVFTEGYQYIDLPQSRENIFDDLHFVMDDFRVVQKNEAYRLALSVVNSRVFR